MLSQNVPRLDDSLPRSLWPNGRGLLGKKDLRGSFYHPPRALGSCSGGGLPGRTAAAVLLLAISRMFCSVSGLGVMLLTVPDQKGEMKTGMERSGPIPSAFRQAGWSFGRGAPTAAARRRRRWTAAGYMYVLICTCIHWVSECAPTRRLPPTSPSLPADGGLAGRTAAAAGPCWTCRLPQEYSALSPSRVLRCRLCLTFA